REELEEKEIIQSKPNTDTTSTQLQRQPEEEEEEEILQTKPITDQETPLIQRQVEREGGAELQTNSKAGGKHAIEPGLESRISGLKGGGQPLDASTQKFFETRFGHDFSHVRVHTGNPAEDAAKSVNARAFTLGNNVVMGSGEFRPQSRSGQHLLAHELTHVVQQGAADRTTGVVDEVHGPAGRKALVNGHKGGERVQRKATAARVDPLCKDYVYFIEKVLIEGQIVDLKATPNVEKRLDLIRELKWIWRCGSEAEKSEVKTKLETGLGAEEAIAIWKEVGTPFGGYRGAFPGYYRRGGKKHLKRLGVSEIKAFESFAYDSQNSSSATFRTGREVAATNEAAILTATDILYFYGHQYAQYNAPGVFANGTQTQFIDLRALAGKGDFSRVKIIVSTSCATCCKEAVETFASIFSNAVILGYRKSAPLKGSVVRKDFDKGIRNLKRPLLLDEPVDVNAIIGVWKSVVERHHPTDETRLPGYYQGGVVHYLELGTWKSMPATGASNSCRKKGGTIEEAAP
ncbi:DUF4157 domain-containing protein, partial [Pseudomonadota bacterium]